MADTKTVRTINDIPGWFTWTDQQLFRHFLRSAAPEEPGDLVELGVYLGKSAVLIGEYQRPGERFVVCDLFNSESDLANNIENTRSYRSLTREAFEDNYRAVRGDLPDIVQGPSSTITEHADPASVRFMHIDASHLYEHVVTDISSALSLLTSDGIVVFDDFRANTPGCGRRSLVRSGGRQAEAHLRESLRLYATLTDPEPLRQGLQDWLITFGRLMWETQKIAGLEVVRLWPPPPGKPAAAPAPNPELADTLKRINRRLSRIEQQLAQTNAQLEQSLGRRVQRSVVRRVKALRSATPQA